MSENSRTYYNKLVRDNIPAKIKAKNEDCGVRTISDKQEFQQELFKKIREEATSLAMMRSRADFLDEYADLMVVLETISAELGITEDDLKAAIEANKAVKGGYAEQHFLLWSDDIGYVSNETPQGIVS